MIERAQHEWLLARECWLRSSDPESIDMRTISSAYRAFRTLLAEQCKHVQPPSGGTAHAISAGGQG